MPTKGYLSPLFSCYDLCELCELKSGEHLHTVHKVWWEYGAGEHLCILHKISCELFHEEIVPLLNRMSDKKYSNTPGTRVGPGCREQTLALKGRKNSRKSAFVNYFFIYSLRAHKNQLPGY